MVTKAIAGIIPGVMAAGLLAHNVKELDFGLNPGKGKKKGKKRVNHTKKIVKSGVTNLIAIPIIGAVGGLTNAL